MVFSNHILGIPQLLVGFLLGGGVFSPFSHFFTHMVTEISILSSGVSAVYYQFCLPMALAWVGGDTLKLTPISV